MSLLYAIHENHVLTPHTYLWESAHTSMSFGTMRFTVIEHHWQYSLLLGISPDCLCRSFRLALSSLGRTLNTSPLSLHTTLSFDTTCWADNKRYQMNYSRKVLEKFHKRCTNPISIPLANRFRLSNSLCPKDDRELNTF